MDKQQIKAGKTFMVVAQHSQSTQSWHAWPFKGKSQ